jgi:transposase
MLPNDLPLWQVVYQQMRRWIESHCFEAMVEDLQVLLREYDGAKRRKGSKVHAAVDTLGHLLALHVTAADEQDRAQVGALAEAVQEITGEHVELVYVDQGHTGATAPEAAAQHGTQLEVIKHTEAKRGFVLLPRRWVVERTSNGQRASAVWQETTSDSPKHSPRCTTWPSPSSCSAISDVRWRKVNNRL